MSNMVIVNAGKQLLLNNALTNSGTVEDFIVGLYQNNHVPTDTDTLAAYTDATFTGYTTFNVPRSTFSAATIVSNVAVTTSSLSPSFTCTGGAAQTVYGFYMKGATSGTLYLAQYFPTARVMSTGSTETLTPFAIDLESI